MIKRIKARNYKAFEHLDIELAPITVFLGPNNSGKSAILSLIRLLSQTAKSNDPNVPLLLNGELGDFGTYKDVVYKNTITRHLELNLSASSNQYTHSFYDVGENDLIELSLGFRYKSKAKELVLKDTRILKNTNTLLRTTYSDDSEKQIVQELNGIPIPQNLRSSLSNRIRMTNFLATSHYSGTRGKSEEKQLEKLFDENPDFVVHNALRPTYFLNNLLYRIEYLGGMRAAPERTFLFSGERRASVGLSGEHAVNLLVLDKYRTRSKSKGLISQVEDWLAKAGIGSKIEIRDLSDRHYELYIQHPDSKEFENFADVGYGNSQILPVLVGGFNLDPGAVFIVEQPEIHLHPRAQAELGDFFRNLCNNGVQSLIETHSEHLVLRLQQYVARKDLDPRDVLFYYIHSTGVEKCITKMKLNERGAFEGEWPEGFFPERLQESKKLAQLRFRFHS